MLRPPVAAFANGALAHAFELDALTRPNSGLHPSATLFIRRSRSRRSVASAAAT